MITPLKARDQLDHQGLERLIEHILGGGAHALFILGTSGEGPALSYHLRRELIERVCKQVRRRVPVLVGITDTAFEEAVRLAGHAADCGAQALVTSTPFYWPVGQPELLNFVERLVPELRLPLYLYTIQEMTKVAFAPETLLRLTNLEQIVGVKDSSGDLEYFDKLLTLKRQRPDWSIFIGPEHLLAEGTRRGGDGGVPGGANVYPELFVELYEAVKAGDAIRAEQLEQTLLQFGKIYAVGQHSSAVIKGMKCGCALRGICSDLMAEPFTRFNPPERERVRAVLQSLRLIEETQPKSRLAQPAGA